MNRNVGKRTFVYVRPAKSQISLRIRAVWSESSLGAFWIAKDARFLHADNEDSDQTAQMRRLIWVFVGRTCQKVHFLKLRHFFQVSHFADLVDKVNDLLTLKRAKEKWYYSEKRTEQNRNFIQT